MEEFVDNFCEFREWLNNLPASSQEEKLIIDKIKNKFDELELNNAF